MSRKLLGVALGGCLLVIGLWALTRLGAQKVDRAGAAEPNKGPHHDYGFTDAFAAEARSVASPVKDYAGAVAAWVRTAPLVPARR